jgi:hypothetical protein
LLAERRNAEPSTRPRKAVKAAKKTPAKKAGAKRAPAKKADGAAKRAAVAKGATTNATLAATAQHRDES